MARFYRPAAIFAFLWRLGMTTSTGSVLGFLVSRALFRTAIMAPRFVALSLSLGTAIFVVVMLLFERFEGRPATTPSAASFPWPSGGADLGRALHGGGAAPGDID